MGAMLATLHSSDQVPEQKRVVELASCYPFFHAHAPAGGAGLGAPFAPPTGFRLTLATEVDLGLVSFVGVVGLETGLRRT